MMMDITYSTSSVVVVQHPKGNVWQNTGKVQKQRRGGHLVYCFVTHKPCKTMMRSEQTLQDNDMILDCYIDTSQGV